MMDKYCRTSHGALLDEYLLERRNRIDDFMKNQWIPKFMENFTKESDVMNELEKTSDANEKNKILQEFVEEASKRIEERKTALVDALNDIRIVLRRKIEEHYGQTEIVRYQ